MPRRSAKSSMCSPLQPVWLKPVFLESLPSGCPSGPRSFVCARPVDMVCPFEVALPRSQLYSALLALSRAPAARGVYDLVDLRRHVVSFLGRQTFDDLAGAVSAAAQAGGIVWVLRDATLPGPPGASGTWCFIPPGASVTIAPRGRPCRLRHFGDASHALFAICNGATLSVRGGLRFEALCSHVYRVHGMAGGGRLYFATVLPDVYQAGRLLIGDDVQFGGYAEIIHRAADHESKLFDAYA